MVVLLMFVVLLVMLAIGLPVAMALGSASVFTLIATKSPLSVVATQMINANNNFTMLAIPFFMFAGSVMTVGGISKKLVDLAQSMIGHVRGGLAIVGTVAAAFFAAISGSNAATAAAVGGALIPEMKKAGYDDDFSASSIAAAGTVGAVIPPSTFMVLYAVSTGTSIGKLFLGGIIPGILMVLCMILIILYQSNKRGYMGIEFQGFSPIFSNFKKSILGLLMPVIILGGIYGGIFSPTESAVVACLYGMLVSMLIYKNVRIKDLPRIFIDSAISTAIVTIILGSAGLFGWILTAYRVPQELAAWLIGFTSNKIIILVLLNILLFFVGTFMNASAAITILAPILHPIILAIGYDPIAFGVIMTVNLSVGCITPPVGVVLFVAQSISNISIERISKAVLPYILILGGLIFIISFFPKVITFLPSLY